MNTPEFQRVFLMILINRYKEYVISGCCDIDPLGVLNAKEDWIGEADDLNYVSKFFKDFEITNNENDFVKSSDINNWIVLNKLGITLQKFTNELKKHCVLENMDNVFKKRQEIQR